MGRLKELFVVREAKIMSKSLCFWTNGSPPQNMGGDFSKPRRALEAAKNTRSDTFQMGRLDSNLSTPGRLSDTVESRGSWEILCCHVSTTWLKHLNTSQLQFLPLQNWIKRASTWNMPGTGLEQETPTKRLFSLPATFLPCQWLHLCSLSVNRDQTIPACITEHTKKERHLEEAQSTLWTCNN